MNEFVLSLLFGGAVILVFSWSQFERPSYEPSRELTRLVEFLLPSDLRNRRVYYRAYAFYAGLLLLTYAAVCIFATVPILEALGMVGVETAQSPIVPLTVSLAMVGLAPSIPVLQRFEERIRFAAHRLSGIPARLLYGCRRLNARVLELPPDGTGYLIPDRDWQRMRHYLRHAGAMLSDPADFMRDLPKIVAYRAWFAEQKLNVPTRNASTSILRNEIELKARIDRLTLGLDAITGFGRPDGASLPDDPIGQPREVWEKFAKEANELAGDVCAMLMLYVEHDLVAPSDAGDEATSKARSVLTEFLEGTQRWAEDGAVAGVIWARATATALIVSAIWGLAFGEVEAAGDGPRLFPLAAGVTYALSTFLIYSLPLFAALSVHDHYSQRKSWPNMALTDWTRWMGPASKLFLVAALVALVCTVALNMYWSLAEFGVRTVFTNVRAGLIAAAAFEGPRAMLGPILALGIVALIDGWRANATQRWQMLAMAITVATMVLWAGLTRGLASQYADAAKCAGEQACLDAIPSLLDLVLADNLMLLMGLRTGAFGLVVLLVCRRTLLRGLGTPPAESGATPDTRAPSPHAAQ